MAYENRRYSVVPYRDEWSALYALEAAIIRATLGDDSISIEHVGSTSVPGLAGKPAIDILAIVRELRAIDSSELALRAVGYAPMGERIAENSRFFKKDAVASDGFEERLANLYIFPEDHAKTFEMVSVRDYLRAHPHEAKKYTELKERLYRAHPLNYLAYREGIEEFLERLAPKAVAWKHEHTISIESKGDWV